jgi:N-acetylglucosamine kinase-like BadF-type ATPase
MKKLLADSGSTKTIWIGLIDNREEFRFATRGINPFYVDENQIVEMLREEVPSEFQQTVFDQIFFYGAGCSLPERTSRVENALQKTWPKPQIRVHHDLLAAARGALIREKGIVAILGTGSNSAYYDGQKIVKNVKSLGFALGDEGSGADIGRRFLKLFYYGILDSDTSEAVRDEMQMHPDTYHSKLFDTPYINREVAKWTRFIASHSTPGIIEQTVVASFGDFFDLQLSRYAGMEGAMSMSAVGSVSVVFEKELRKVAAEKGFEIKKCFSNPTNGLVSFHQSE